MTTHKPKLTSTVPPIAATSSELGKVTDMTNSINESSSTLSNAILCVSSQLESLKYCFMSDFSSFSVSFTLVCNFHHNWFLAACPIYLSFMCYI